MNGFPVLHHSGRCCQAQHAQPRARILVAKSFSGCSEGLANPGLVVGVGGCGIDYMASVARFPDPDQKLRTERLEVHGGGNCGNALTAAARLGLRTRILSKIGDDALGDAIVEEFKSDGVNTDFLVRAPGSSPFTYIIVDRKGGTRTCIHTPGEPMLAQEATPELCSELLEGASIAYFDGRLTDAAIVVAIAARKAGIPVFVEAERLRPNLELLMAEADYIMTSADFPRDWTGEECIGDALLATALRLPHVKFVVRLWPAPAQACAVRECTQWLHQRTAVSTRCLSSTATSVYANASLLQLLASPLARRGVDAATANKTAAGRGTHCPVSESSLHAQITTLGSKGSILLEIDRDGCGIGQGAPAPQAELQATIDDLFQQLQSSGHASQSAACQSASGVDVAPCRVVSTPIAIQCAFNRKASHEQAVLEQALAASVLAAALNAEEGAGSAYTYGGGTLDPEDALTSDDIKLCAKVYVASCSQLSDADFVDSTGAGDAFLGSVLYSLVTGKSNEDMLKLGAVVAACKCTALGARPGLPYRKNLASDIL